MNEEVMKSLVSLIDETIAEVDELKKSGRFSASEIKLDGPGSDGIAGKPANGSLGKDEDEKKKKEEEDKKKKDEAEKAEMDKGEGQNRQADPNGGHHKMDKNDAKTGEPEGTAAKADMDKGEGQNRQADPNGGHHKMDKKEDKDEDKKKDKKDEDKDEKDGFEEKMKKSAEEANTLLKSYVDERLSPIEKKLEGIMSLVKEIADSPVAAKGQTYRSFDPLKKSDDSAEGGLTKAQLVDKLFELKKSGTRVDSVDIASAELAKGADLVKIANKYNIK